MFGTILISICTLMHIYVFWRVTSVPLVSRHVPLNFLIATGALLWAIFFIGRVYGHRGTGALATISEFLGMIWMGALLLLFISLLAADMIPLLGFLLPRLAPLIRSWLWLPGSCFQSLRSFRACGLRWCKIMKCGLQICRMRWTKRCLSPCPTCTSAR